MAHKRANNEGTMYYRESRQQWCAQVSLEGRRLTKYARTQKECRDWIKETLAKIGNGLTFTGTQVTLEQYVPAWLDGKELSLRPKTIALYRQVWRQHILPRIGKLRLQEIQAPHLTRFYKLLKDEGQGTRSIELIHSVLHTVLKQAVRDGILGRNPADALDRPTSHPKERVILTEEQALGLVMASQNTRYGMLVYLALSTGLREGELLGLKWSDVNWVNGKLNVQRQLQHRTGHGYELVPPKSKSGYRQVKLGPNTLERLSAHKEQQDLQKTIIGDHWVENDLIFPNTLGKPESREHLLVTFQSTLKKNNLPKIRFHDLRHTNLSFLLDGGTPVNTVQRRAGHSKASITTDTYGHAMDHSEDDAAKMIEEMITPVAVKLQSK